MDFTSTCLLVNLLNYLIHLQYKPGISIFLTDEVTHQISAWLKYKYRTRRVCHQIKKDTNKNKKTITAYRTLYI